MAILDALGLRVPLGTIPNDGGGTADFGEAAYGAAILVMTNFVTSGPFAFFSARKAASLSLTTMFSSGARFTTQTSELTGATDDDGKVNFSVTDDGRLIVGNRRGYGVAYTLYVFLR